VADLLRIGEERLAHDLSTALTTRRATPRLREAIAEFVRAAKDGGFSWQDTTAAVNALMRQAASGQAVTADVDALAQRILGWCEEEYAQRG
jgi:predicted RNA-binding Zn ribbon-like protein